MSHKYDEATFANFRQMYRECCFGRTGGQAQMKPLVDTWLRDHPPSISQPVSLLIKGMDLLELYGYMQLFEAEETATMLQTT